MQDGYPYSFYVRKNTVKRMKEFRKKRKVNISGLIDEFLNDYFDFMENKRYFKFDFDKVKDLEIKVDKIKDLE